MLRPINELEKKHAHVIKANVSNPDGKDYYLHPLKATEKTITYEVKEGFVGAAIWISLKEAVRFIMEGSETGLVPVPLNSLNKENDSCKKSEQ